VSAADIGKKSTCELLHHLFQNVTCQAQLPRDRNKLYLIAKVCGELQFASVQESGPDFLYGLISAMEGETDPQNLLLIFSYLPSLLQKMAIDHLTSDIFEVFSTYFPVDFTTVSLNHVIYVLHNRYFDIVI